MAEVWKIAFGVLIALVAHDALVRLPVPFVFTILLVAVAALVPTYIFLNQRESRRLDDERAAGGSQRH